jgi:glycosyltransferase involved in cell wall biosynthesis
MRILYVSQYFPPEIGAPAARVHELSREWVRRGHDVTVLTAFPHHPSGVKRPEDRGVLERRERVDGIELLRTYVYAVPNKGIVKRMASYASFMTSAIALGPLRLSSPDVVIATSPQLLCGVAGYALSRSFGAPFVFEVRDLWPESILAVDAMGDNAVIRGLKSVARFLYRTCDRIVTVGEGYKRSIHQLYSIDPDKMSVIPNGIDPALFSPLPRDNEVRREYGWGDKFVLLYLGTHGMAHALDKVLEVAGRLREDQRLQFVFVGDGAEKENLKRRAASANLTNVQFIDPQPKSRVPLFYAACDLGVVTLRDTSLFQEVLPSKIFEYLGMERAILLGVGGEARRLVESAGAGVYVPPEDVDAMASSVRMLSRDPARLEEMGRGGRLHVLQHYDRGVLAERYLNLLAGVGPKGTPAPKH